MEVLIRLITVVFSIFIIYIFYKGLKSIVADFNNCSSKNIKEYFSNLKTLFEKEKIDEDSSNKIKKIIGIGGGGSNIVEFLSKDFDSLIVNSDKKALSLNKVANKIHLEKPDQLGCGSNENCGFSLINEKVLNQIDDFMQDYEEVTLIATLGGGVGSGSTKAIGEYLSAKDINVKCILVKPFFWEGLKKKNRAMDTINYLQQFQNINISQLENDELKNFEHLTMKQSFNLLNNKIKSLI